MSWMRTCGLYPEDSGRSLNDLNQGSDLIGITLYFRDGSGFIRGRTEEQ